MGAFVGNIFLERGDGGSPELFTRVCPVFDISGVGVANEQIESTTFCSGGVKEYIGGLADGTEPTLALNFDTVDPNKSIIIDMVKDVRDKKVRAYRLAVDGDNDNVIDLYIYYFATALSWTLAPSPTAKNAINFGSKISGQVSWYDATGTQLV